MTSARPVTAGGRRTNPRLLVPLGILGLAAIVALWGTAVVRRQRRELSELQRVAPAAERRVAAAARDRQAALDTLRQARRDLAALPEAPAPNSPLAARNAEIQAWLGRVHALHALFTAHPDAAIPEMGWLTDDDWLRAAKDASLGDESGTRRAMADVRSTAKSHFGALISKAFERAKAANATLTTAEDLAPYFDPPAPTAILARYELVGRSKAVPQLIGVGGQAEQVLREKAPVDETYDGRYGFGTSGTIVQGGGPLSWEDGLWTRVNRAFKAYSTANPNAAGHPQLRDVIPYAQPPIDAATAARLLEADRADKGP